MIILQFYRVKQDTFNKSIKINQFLIIKLNFWRKFGYQFLPFLSFADIKLSIWLRSAVKSEFHPCSFVLLATRHVLLRKVYIFQNANFSISGQNPISQNFGKLSNLRVPAKIFPISGFDLISCQVFAVKFKIFGNSGSSLERKQEIEFAKSYFPGPVPVFRDSDPRIRP